MRTGDAMMARTTTGSSTVAYNWKNDLARLEEKYGIPPGLLGALVRAESGGQLNVRSPAGAIGLTQLMPGTAHSLGVNPYDPRQNLEGGAKYLSQQLKRFKSVPKALAAYNAGPGAVQRYGGIPPYSETKTYVSRLMGYWKESSRYGQQNNSSDASSKPSTVSRPSPKAVQQQPLPEALPRPERAVQPGLDDKSLAQLNIAFNVDPQMAQNVQTARQRKQDAMDTDYINKMGAYQTRQQQIQSIREANQQRLNQPVKYSPGTVGTTQTFGPQGPVNRPGQKYFKTPNGWVANWKPGEQGYQFLNRLGSGFGLQHDPGNAQTTGGNHSSGSLHYSGLAADYGNARNPMTLLNQWYSWLNTNRNAIGISQLLHEDPGTSNEHIHVGLNRR